MLTGEPIDYLSKCCRAELTCCDKGSTTQFYLCNKCFHPCDVVAVEVNSYPRIMSIDKPEVQAILDSSDGNKIIQEKIDGSQFSFACYKNGSGERFVRFRSKSLQLGSEADNMFKEGIDAITGIRDLLRVGYTYRCEYLRKKRHNTLAYDRIPKYHVVIFDIQDEIGRYLPLGTMMNVAAEAGLEAVMGSPILEGTDILNLVKSSLDRVSMLGGCKVEGYVIKDHTKTMADGSPLMAKFVSDDFKEVHRGQWRENNPGKDAVIEKTIRMYKTPARWEKAVNHLRDRGELTSTSRDIGALMAETSRDVKAEHEPEIKDFLFNNLWPKISKGVTCGLAEWYKGRLNKDEHI